MTRLLDLAKPTWELGRTAVQGMLADAVAVPTYLMGAAGMIEPDTAKQVIGKFHETFGYTPSEQAVKTAIEAVSAVPEPVKSGASLVGRAVDFLSDNYPRSSLLAGGTMAATPLIPARASIAISNAAAKTAGTVAKTAKKASGKAAGAALRKTGAIVPAPAKPAPSGLLALPAPDYDARLAAAKAGVPSVAIGNPDHAARAAEIAVARDRMPNGQYVGAPQGIDTPAKREGLVRQYIENFKKAFEAGVKPGWFYKEGRGAIGAVSDTPDTAHKAARTLGITTNDATPQQNWGWAVQAAQQDAMGVPLSVGKYPNDLRPAMEASMAGGNEFIGHKGQRFANALDPTNPSAPFGPAPNDQQELFSMNYTTKSGNAIKGASATQNAFMDAVREEARVRAAQELGIPLKTLEAQEVHWTVPREGSVPRIAEDATIQGAIPRYRVQHSWETTPGVGEMAEKWGTLSDAQKAAYHEGMVYVFRDPVTGKDTMLDALGARMQEPMIFGPGYWNNQTTPYGVQSMSQQYMTGAGGLAPEAQGFVDWSEYLRATLLSQGAEGAHASSPRKPGMLDHDYVEKRFPPGLGGEAGLARQEKLEGMLAEKRAETGVTRMKVGRPATPAEVRAVGSALQDKVPGTIPIVSPEGVNAVALAKNAPEMADQIDALLPVLKRIMGDDLEVSHQLKHGTYRDLPPVGQRTTMMLKGMARDTRVPKLMEHAFGQKTQMFMQRLHIELTQQKAAGIPVPDNVLRLTEAWSQPDALIRVKRLARQGLAPAATLTAAVELLRNSGQEKKQPDA